MKYLFRILVISLVLLGLSSCAQTPPLSPLEYTQLLTNIKDIFSVSLLLMMDSNTYSIRQSIARLYYGHYHLCRLIYNNLKGRDSDNHTTAWEVMRKDLEDYGKDLKEMRIKYDYQASIVDENDVYADLEYIVAHKCKFDSLIEELKNTVGRFNSNPFFDKDFDAKIAEVETVYESLLKSIEALLKKKKP